ncbi:hypothetical protein J132_01397, partial [Termitomyces sp. J132]
KSFMYSHVVQVAPSKSVKTQARVLIDKIQAAISIKARAYGKCQCSYVITNLTSPLGALPLHKSTTQQNRWTEECQLVTSEMEWTVCYFLKQTEIWSKRGMSAKKKGLQAYADKKVAMWHELSSLATHKFRRVYNDFTPPQRATTLL